MTVADIPLGLELRQQAGWNQTESDWRRFLELQPDGCFVAEWEGKPVGTTTTCLFDDIGWIAMVLVEQAARHRGIGTLSGRTGDRILVVGRCANHTPGRNPAGTPRLRAIRVRSRV